MTKNLQDLRAEAKTRLFSITLEPWDNLSDLLEKIEKHQGTLIDSVLDRVEACVPVARVPELVDGKYANDYEEGLQDGSDSCRVEMLTNLSTLRS